MLNQFKLKTMTYFYYKTTKTWNGQPQYKQMTNSEEETIDLWKHLSDKKNWRMVVKETTVIATLGTMSLDVKH